MSTNPLQRRVVFQEWEDVNGVAPFDLEAASKAVKNLPATGWAFVEPDFTTAVLIDDVGDNKEPTCLRCFRLRAGDDVPHKLDGNRVPSPLQLLRNESITDWMHVVIWPDHYAAYDSRRDSPSLSRLSGYLGEMVKAYVHFVGLFDRSLIDELDSLDEIKSIDIKFELSKLEQMANLKKGGLFEGLRGVGRRTAAATVTTKVSVGTSRKKFLSSATHEELAEMAASAEDYLDHLTVTGISGDETVHVDLLTKRLDEQVKVARSRGLGNAPDPQHMYAAIKQARKNIEKSKRLARAVRVA